MVPARKWFFLRKWTFRQRFVYSLIVGIVAPLLVSWVIVLAGPYELALRLRRYLGLADRGAIWRDAAPQPQALLPRTVDANGAPLLETAEYEYFRAVVGELRTSHASQNPPRPLASMQILWSYGWPIPCLAHVREILPAADGIGPATIRTRWGIDIGLERHRRLPLRPLFVPYLLNAGVLGGLVFVAISARTWWNESRQPIRVLSQKMRTGFRKAHAPEGCPDCGYDVQDLTVCPECGTPQASAPSLNSVTDPAE